MAATPFFERSEDLGAWLLLANRQKFHHFTRLAIF